MASVWRNNKGKRTRASIVCNNCVLEIQEEQQIPQRNVDRINVCLTEEERMMVAVEMLNSISVDKLIENKDVIKVAKEIVISRLESLFNQ